MRRSCPGSDGLRMSLSENGGLERTVLHIVADTYVNSDYRFHGSTKDIKCREQYFLDRGIAFDLIPHRKNYATLRESLPEADRRRYSHVLLDGSFEPQDVEYLRARYPYARLLSRSHNSELRHRKDTCMAAAGIPALEGKRRGLRKNIRVYLERDCAVARLVDCVLTIEPQSTAAPYWRRMGFRGELLSAPYFLADEFLGDLASKTGREAQPRQNSVVCMTSAYPGPLIYEMLRNFQAAVLCLGTSLPEWRFEVTGKPLEGYEGEGISRMKHLGIVDDPLAVLRRAKALAVLSDYGRGFKTKILDAIICGAWVLVTPALFRRLPDAVKPYCLRVDLEKQGNFAEVLAEVSRRPKAAGDPNAELRAEAYAAMDSAFS